MKTEGIIEEKERQDNKNEKEWHFDIRAYQLRCSVRGNSSFNEQQDPLSKKLFLGRSMAWKTGKKAKEWKIYGCGVREYQNVDEI